MSSSITRLSPATRQALESAVEAFSPDTQSEPFEHLASTPGQRSASGSSRQARHARLVRAKNLGIAGVVILAAEHEQFADALLAPDFGTLHPLSADVHRRAWYILENHTGISVEGASRLFDRAAERVVTLGQRLSTCERDEALSMQGALLGLFLGCIVLPQHFGRRWQSLLERVADAGLLANPQLRMQLAMAGSHVGHCELHLDWLLDPSVRAFDAADGYLFVRRDDSEDLLEALARGIRGDDLQPEDGLMAQNPASTVRLLANYIRTCMRDPAHFSNQGQVLMTLQWIEEVWERTRALCGRGLSVEDQARLTLELKKIERVQRAEKSRFWRVHEIARPDIRAELSRLWSRTYHADNEEAAHESSGR